MPAAYCCLKRCLTTTTKKAVIGLISVIRMDTIVSTRAQGEISPYNND